MILQNASQKLHEIEKILDRRGGGGSHRGSPLRTATVNLMTHHIDNLKNILKDSH